MTQPDLSIFETSTPVDENQPDLTIFENTQNLVITEAVKVNPAEQAKLNRLSRESQLPPDMIEGDLQGIEQDLKTQSIDLSKSPKTADWMSKYENAAVAHTDVDTLKNVELTMADIPLGVDYKVTPDVEPETVKDLLRAWGRGSGNLVSSLGQLLSVVESGGNQLAARAENIVRAGVGAEPVVPADTAVSDWLREIGNQTTIAPVYEPSQYSRDRAADVQAAEGFFGTIKSLGENPSQIIEGVIQSAPSFVGPAALTRIAGITNTAKTVAVTSGAVEGGAAGADARQEVLNMSFADMVEDSPRYVDMVAQGVDSQKAKEILAEEAGLTATAITIPIATLLTKATGAADIEGQFFTDQKVFDTFAKWIKGTGVETVEETGQSATSQVATNVGVGTTGDQTRDPLQGVEEAAAQGAVLGAAQSGGIKSVEVVRDIFHEALTASRAIKQREVVFNAQQKTIDKLAELSDQAELKKLDAESFKQFVNHIDGDRDTRVHLDAVQTQLYLNSLGDKTDPAITMLREALGEAATLGYDVTIPVGDFAVTIAGSPHFEALREFMSMSDNSPSPFRKESDDAAAREYLRSVVDVADENVTLHQQKQEYSDQVRDQLVDTGRMSAKDAAMSAAVVPEWAASFAKRNGMTLEQVKQQLDLKIEGPLSGELSRLTDELQKFDQDGNPVESDWLSPINKSKAIGDETLLFSENDVEAYESDYKTSTSRSIRYVKKNEKGEIIGVLQFHTKGSRSKKAVISNVYTRSDYRRQKVAANLLIEARKKFDIKHSDDLTNDGEAFAKADGVFYQFAGVNSRTAIMNDLERAKQMREKGLGNDATARQTGWFLGVDGRWRYEISDDQAKWRVVPTADPFSAAGTSLDDLSQKIYGVPFDKLPRMSDSSERQNIIRRQDNLTRLDNYLDHPELFKAYSQLGSIRVTVDNNMDDGDLGVYFERQNTIQLNSKSSPEQMLSTVLHELQHAIQSIEDFARGGSMNADFTTNVKNAIQNLSKGKTEEVERWEWRNQWKIKAAEKAAEISRNGVMYRSAIRLMDYANRDKPSSVFRHIRNESQWIYGEQFYGNREANDLQRLYYDIPKSGKKRNDAIQQLSKSIGEFLLKQIPEDQLYKFKNDERTTDSMLKALSREASLLRRGLKPFQELKAEAKRAVELDQVSLIKNPYEIYRALAGEIEARTTQNRMKLTPEQRRTRPVSLDQDLPSSEAIVVVGGMEIKVPEAMMSQEPVIERDSFKRWFGDSKAVDENGKPMVVYHGTGKNFNTFSLDAAQNTDTGMMGKGFYFTSSPVEANRYARGANPVVIPVYLSLKNPFITDDYKDFPTIPEPKTIEEMMQADLLYSKQLRDKLIDDGYDGVIFTRKDGSKEFVAFYSNQIKSATENNGEFNSNDPDIFNQIGLHSAVESTVETMNLPAWKNGGSANGVDVWAKLQSSPGVKKEELKWLGIEEFLTAEPRKFSRDEVMQFVKTNGVQVVEVVADKSEDNAQTELYFSGIHFHTDDDGREVVEFFSEVPRGTYHMWAYADSGKSESWSVTFDGDVIAENVSKNEAEIQANAHARENGFIVESEAEIARFGGFTTEIPGSSPGNYRELKLTLPNIKDQFVYKAHFSDPNVVAFMRVSDRDLESPNGYNTFFIEELQSDWHQKGRQKGYKTGNFNQQEVAKELSIIQTEISNVTQNIFDELSKKYRTAQLSQGSQIITFIILPDETTASILGEFDRHKLHDYLEDMASGITPVNPVLQNVYKELEANVNESLFQEFKKLNNRRNELQELVRVDAHGVPDAPFKNDEWISLSLKRALVIAAKEGYTSVAWPNAEVLMERWSDEYETLYRNLYDGKVKSIIKKLTKQEPVTTPFNGRYGYDEGMGYHSITITPELREQILTDSFNLFQKSRGYYEPKNSLIRLNESSNLSTFLHEFAHAMYEMELVNNGSLVGDIHNWFKRNAKDVAAEAQTIINQQTPDFTKPPVIISNDDVVAYLDNKTTGDTDKDSALRIATHEQFARGYEVYLMEGKSPSEELRDVFRTFTRWLVAIYKNIRGLNVKLDDDARRFFDRLTATDVQIRAAQVRANYSAMFNDASMAGMSDKEFEKYQQQKQRVKDKADETLRDKMIAQLRRRTEKWWKEEKQDMVDQVKVELNNQPVYRAINGMRSGTVKMDHQAVLDLFGEDVTNAVGIESRRIPTALRNMTVKGAQGVRPDDAAAFFGFASASEMVEQIKSTSSLNKAADEKAEQIMIDRHGDILNDGTIEKEADEAVQNEERAELLLMELKALAKGSRIPVIDRQVLKATAEDAIAKLSYREIHPAKYRRAEIRAAQESAVALKNGNREEATRAKARQLMNHYLANAATDARNETMRIVDSMSRYSKKKVREEIMKAEGGYWEQIVNILSRFEFRKSATLDQVDQVNQGINLWAKERIEVDGDGLVLSPVVLNELYQTHWKNVKFSDLKGIADSVKNIEYVARYSNKLTRMGDELEFKQLVTRWVDHLKQQPVRFTSQRTDTIRGKNWGRWAMAQMTKIPYLCSWLDGNERVGLSHQILMQPLNDAYSKELALWKTVGNDVLKALESRSAEDRKRHATKIFIKEIQDEKNDGNLFGSQILAVALNTGNESNLRKMLLGEGWANPDDDTTISMNNPQLKAVLKHMTKSDWDLVQLLWDKMEELYPQLAEVHRRTTGLTPQKIEATKITTPFGEYRGGYYPVKYDPARSFKSELNEEKLNAQTESMFATSGSIQASVNASATNERTKYYAPINLNLDVIPNHFQETIHYITHHDAVREINKLLRNPSVAEAIKGVVGPEEYAQLRPWLNDVAKDGREAPAKMFWDAVLQRLRFGVTLGSMGFKVSTAIMQLSGLSNTVAEVGIKNVYKSLRTILGSPKTMQSAWEFASENSKILKYRTQTMDREIKNALNQLSGKNGMLAAVQELSMKHIAYTQTFAADLPSWYAAYIKKMDETGDEQKAYQYADWVVENIQGSGATKDMARIMRGQSEAGKMFTMFMTFFSALWNMERDLVKGIRNKTYSVTTVGAKVAFLFTLPVLFEMLVRGEFGGDDEDDETLLQKTLTKTALFPFQSIPFARDMINGATGDYGYNISPVASLLEQGMRSVPELISRPMTDEEITKSQVKGATKFVGAALGIPGTSQVWSTGESLYDVLVEGEDRTMREILVTGPDKQ
jgi:hypothetical protein